MITSTAFTGKHYAVLGLARSGRATVDALLASGARVTAWDDNEEARQKILPGTGRGTSFAGGGGPQTLQSATIEIDSAHGDVGPLHHAAHGLPPRSGEEPSVTDFTQADLTQFDSIVVTPGLPLNRHPIAARAKAAGVEIIGDIELFARARAELPPHKVVGITGTNGKSTTTALVHHILHTAGVPSLMGGNIGLPILAQDPLPQGGIYVLELSSYQLDLTQTLDCDVAVLLNITPDHLDRYESFEAYAASKTSLFEMQTLRHYAIMIEDNGRVSAIADSFQEFYDHSCLLRLDPMTANSELRDRAGDQRDWPSLQGPHNFENVLTAVWAVRNIRSKILGRSIVSWEAVQESLRTFPGLPHRMERIAEKDGIAFVNDSKATNAEAAAPALAAFSQVRWIVGGQAKAATLGDTANHLDHVAKAYAIGEAGAMFARLLREAKVEVDECGTLEKAVKQAAADAKAGDTVLLSPACASFDQFADYEARGNAFRAAVEAL